MSTPRTPPPGSSSQIFDSNGDGGDQTSVPASNNVTKRPSKRPAVNSPPIENLPEGADDASNTAQIRNIIEDVVQREMSNLLTKLNTSMGTLLNTQLKSIRDEIQDVKESMSFMSSQYEEINKELKASKKSIQELQLRSDKLQPTINDIHFRINQIEQAARSNNIEIQCMPEKKNENLVELVSQLGSIINHKISEQNIIHCTRIAKVNRESSRPRSIVVQFDSTRTRDHILAATISFNKSNPQNKLNSTHFGIPGTKTPIFVSEHLSPANKALHAATRIKANEKGFKYVWVRSGKIFVRKNDTAGYIVIRNMDTLSKLE